MITEYKNVCLICGRIAEETHHLIFGRGIRPIAEKDGITAPLCAHCHRLIHNAEGMGVLSKIIGQLQWEKEHIDLDPEQAREAFRSRYGRSWL